MLTQFIVTLIKRILNLFNLSLTRIDKFDKSLLPRNLEISLVLDVGANIGQYGDRLRTTGYKGKIVSFEPIAAAHRKLIEASSRDQNWVVHSRIALGKEPQVSEIQISGNSVSSSFLFMSDEHLYAAPDSKYSAIESVEIDTLDNVAPEYFKEHSNIALKIDVQGYELEVLKGSASILRLVDYIQIEMSLVDLYINQVLYFEIDNFLRDRGFHIWGILPGFKDPRNGRLLQFDGKYISTSALQRLTNSSNI